MKILVTGAGGFVGSHFSQIENNSIIPLKDDAGAVDIRDSERVRKIVLSMQPDAVLHLAAQSFVPRSFENPLETFDINFNGTFSLLSALQKADFKGRMLFVGSGDVYGLVDPDSLPITETTPLRPRNPYSVSKVAAEALCYQWSQTGPFQIISARSFNHIGPGQSDRFAISDFARQIVEIQHGLREPKLTVGDIDVTRDFTDVRDVVHAYEMLIREGRNGEVYNVCSGEEQSVRSMIERLLLLAGVEVAIEQDATRLRPSEQRRVYASNKKLKHHTGWYQELKLDTSLKDLLDYWEKTLT